MFYRFIQILALTAWRAFGRVEVQGLENVPKTGPFLLISNHQSYLDPILLQASVPREVHAMAKSTQFAHPVTGFLLKRLKSFPVRRFQIDPQAVRIALRVLRAGHGVGIYVEGERSWDARLQPPRLGVLRLILRAGVPVIPCGIRGAYDAWPRWDRTVTRGRTVHIEIGPPLDFPHLVRREDREAALPDTRARLMSTLAELARLEWEPEAGRRELEQGVQGEAREQRERGQ